MCSKSYEFILVISDWFGRPSWLILAQLGVNLLPEIHKTLSRNTFFVGYFFTGSGAILEPIF
jgi:hypothetical protein